MLRPIPAQLLATAVQQHCVVHETRYSLLYEEHVTAVYWASDSHRLGASKPQ